MPSKRCAICQQMRQIDDLNLCCQACEEIELDLLIATYAFIHCQSSEFAPIKDVISQIEPIRGIKVTTAFMKNWVNKNWLDKNEVDSVRVPPPVRESLEEEGFTISSAVRRLLNERKNKKPQLDPSLGRSHKQSKEQSGRRHTGMIYMEKQKN